MSAPATTFRPTDKGRHRAVACPADMRNTALTIHHWSVETGLTYLVIVGPGPNAFQKCSQPQWKIGRKPGTHDEHRLAQAALQILISRHRDDKEAGEKAIQAALREAATNLKLTHILPFE